jgi:hypothetical protein
VIDIRSIWERAQRLESRTLTASWTDDGSVLDDDVWLEEQARRTGKPVTTQVQDVRPGGTTRLRE